MHRKAILFATALIIISLIVTACASTEISALQPRERFQVATTTSLYDTGLWGYIEPEFEQKYDVELDVMYAGTGYALELGRRGDVDAITVHSKSREEQFVEEGYGVERVPAIAAWRGVEGAIAGIEGEGARSDVGGDGGDQGSRGGRGIDDVEIGGWIVGAVETGASRNVSDQHDRQQLVFRLGRQGAEGLSPPHVVQNGVQALPCLAPPIVHGC